MSATGGRRKTTKKAAKASTGKTAARRTNAGRKSGAKAAGKPAARPARKKAASGRAGTAGKKPARRKAAARKATTRKSAVRKVGKEAAAGKISGKKVRRKATVKKAAAGKATARKSATRKTATRKAATRKRPAPKAPSLPRKASVVLEPAVVAAWRLARQGLEQPSLHSPHDLAEALNRSGWLALGGGVEPYLAMAARFASFARHDLDRCLFQQGTLMEVPGMGGKRLLLPPAEAWMALQAFRSRVDDLLKSLLSRHRVMTRAALANLEDVVRAVLAGQALPVETLRTRVPPRLLKDLGSHGARVGLATSVDLALWHLWARGEVVSRPVERRLDRRRREYVLRGDLQGPSLTADIRMRGREEWLAALAARYLTWAGLARLEDLAWWADVPSREAAPALAGLGLTPVGLKGMRGVWLMHGADLESLQSFRPPERPAVCLLPRQDMLAAAWRSYEGLLAPADVVSSLASSGEDGGGRHFVMVGGSVAGVWGWGPDGAVRLATLRTLDDDLSGEVRRRAAALSEFIRRDLRPLRAAGEGPAGAPGADDAAEGRWPGGAVQVGPGGAGPRG